MPGLVIPDVALTHGVSGLDISWAPAASLPSTPAWGHRVLAQSTPGEIAKPVADRKVP